MACRDRGNPLNRCHFLPLVNLVVNVPVLQPGPCVYSCRHQPRAAVESKRSGSVRTGMYCSWALGGVGSRGGERDGQLKVWGLRIWLLRIVQWSPQWLHPFVGAACKLFLDRWH